MLRKIDDGWYESRDGRFRFEKVMFDDDSMTSWYVFERMNEFGVEEIVGRGKTLWKALEAASERIVSE